MITWLFLNIHVMKVAGISPLNHLKFINWCLIPFALRISPVTLLYKLQNATKNWYSGEMPAAKQIVSFSTESYCFILIMFS